LQSQARIREIFARNPALDLRPGTMSSRRGLAFSGANLCDCHQLPAARTLVMPVHTAAFKLVPWGFFALNPALDLSPGK
jgi:hypothetical protein